MTYSKRVFFSISGVLLLLSGIAQILLDAIIAYEKYVSGDYKLLLLGISVLCLGFSGMLSVIIASISLANRKKRLRTEALTFFGRFIILLTTAGCVFLGLRSIYIWQIAGAAILGIIFPMIYVISVIRRNLT